MLEFLTGGRVLRRMRRWVPMAVVVAVAAVGIVDAGGAGAAPRTRTVDVVDSVYKPRRIRVRSGTKVVWRFDGTLPHNVEVFSGPELFSSTIMRKGTFARRFRARG